MKEKNQKKIKLHIKTGDKVMVIAGDSKGKEGEVVSVDLKKQRAIVQGLNMVKKHQKPSASNPNGEIVEMEAPIHISNLMVMDPDSGKPRRTGRRRNSEGKLERYFKEHSSVKED